MITVRLAKDRDLEYVEEMISGAKCKRFNKTDLLMVGEIDGEIISTASLKTNENTGLMHSLFVKKEYRGQHIGDMTARAIINLADKKGLETLYYLCDDLEFSYFLSKMHYVPTKIEKIQESFKDYIKNDQYAFKLNLEEFFNQGCSCSNN